MFYCSIVWCHARPEKQKNSMGNSLAVSINQEFKKNRNSFDLKNKEIKCMRFSEQFNLIGTKWFIYLQENSHLR